MGHVESASARSWLLVNASKIDEYSTAFNSEADQIILDLEDAVAPHEKDHARTLVKEFLSEPGHHAWVRINDASSEFWSSDCRELAHVSGLRGVVLAKTEGVSHVWDTSDRLSGEKPVIPLIETARGLTQAQAIASARPSFRLALGVNDYTLDIGVPNDPLALAYSRSQLVIASRAARIPGPIDGPARETQGLEDSVSVTNTMGMTGKLVLDEHHCALVNEGLSPSREEIGWAQQFIEEFRARGGTPVNGSDLPHLHRSEAVLTKAQHLGLISADTSE